MKICLYVLTLGLVLTSCVKQSDGNSGPEEEVQVAKSQKLRIQIRGGQVNFAIEGSGTEVRAIKRGRNSAAISGEAQSLVPFLPAITAQYCNLCLQLPPPSPSEAPSPSLEPTPTPTASEDPKIMDSTFDSASSTSGVGRLAAVDDVRQLFAGDVQIDWDPAVDRLSQLNSMLDLLISLFGNLVTADPGLQNMPAHCWTPPEPELEVPEIEPPVLPPDPPEPPPPGPCSTDDLTAARTAARDAMSACTANLSPLHPPVDRPNPTTEVLCGQPEVVACEALAQDAYARSLSSCITLYILPIVRGNGCMSVNRRPPEESSKTCWCLPRVPR